MHRFLFILLFLAPACAFNQVVPRHGIGGQKSIGNKPQHDPPIVVNNYIEVLAYDICTNQLTVADGTDYFVGDTVLLIQMKGAVIDTSNTPAFGTVLSYGNAGNYEFNYISQKSGNIITLKNKLTKNYDIPWGVVQLVRVPYYKAGYFSGGLTCDPWDGNKGGVLAIFCETSLISEEVLDVSGKGFKGGAGYVSPYTAATCNQNNFYYPGNSSFGALKGESIGSLSPNYRNGKGSFAGGGGGGNSHNAGGGGGGNGGNGGFGGYQTDSCGAAPFDNRGIGGKKLNYSPTGNKIFLGGGGGGGHADQIGISVPYAGDGGGIMIIITDSLWIRDEAILANGIEGVYCYSGNCMEGLTGGGSGGTVLLVINQIIDSVSIETKGGNGENIDGPIFPGGKAGPGGGGGGGVFYYNGASMPVNMKYKPFGGNNGVVLQDSNNPWGATKGSDGISYPNFILPVDIVPFVPNIDSVRFSDSVNYCNNLLFKGRGYTNTYPPGLWQWDFGDGFTGLGQNVMHNFIALGNYSIKLVMADINGCKDSITRVVNTSGPMIAYAGPDQMICSSGLVTTTLTGSGSGNGFSWSPAIYLNNSTLQNPIATIPNSTTFYLTVTNNAGCSANDTVNVTLVPMPVIKAAKSNDVNCTIQSAQLQASGGIQYSWSPVNSLNNGQIQNPIATPKKTTLYTVTGTNNNGCSGTDTITVIAIRNGGLELPNSFTPNDDSKNDCFGIKYPGGVTNLRFVIYNYLGQKVFETSDPFLCWKGMYKGKKADMGNYVYYLTGDTNCGPVELTGNVLLLR